MRKEIGKVRRQWASLRMYDRRSSAEETNADLRRDNRRRWKISTKLLALSLLIVAISSELPRSSALDKIPFAIFIISYGGGMMGLYLARGESAFLNKPDPSEAPQWWKFPQ
jgi:hypothetical protein